MLWRCWLERELFSDEDSKAIESQTGRSGEEERIERCDGEMLKMR